MTKETILVVDDNPEMLTVIVQGVLRPSGFEVITVASGEACLEKVAKGHPDLILIDLGLPGMNGLEVITALRQMNFTAPIILMTAFGSERTAVEAFRLGVKDYLTKPFAIEEARCAVDQALNETRLARERDELNRKLLLAEGIRLTVVTLSHYLNNYLTSLKGSLVLLAEAMALEPHEPGIAGLLEDSQKSAIRIEAVMRVMKRATEARLAPYSSSTLILDIENWLQKELQQMLK